MSKYLQIMAGDMDEAKMKSLGLDDAQIKLFKSSQKTAEDAARKVRTFTQLVGTVKEAVGSGWGETAEILIGNFDDATDLFTDVNNVVSKMVDKYSDARNNLLRGWVKMGGRSDIIEALSNVFHAAVAILKPIHEAFTNIFPPATAAQLKAISQAIQDFTAKLIIGKDTSALIQRSFAGLFAVLHIGWMIVKAIGSAIFDFFGYLSQGSGSLLEFTAGIGDWLVGLDLAIEKGDIFNRFFEVLGNVIKIPLAALGVLGGALVTFFSNLTDNPLERVGEYFGRLQDRLSPLGSLARMVGKAWDALLGVLSQVGDVMAPVIGVITAAFGRLFDAIADSLRSGDFSGINDALNTGLFAVLVLAIKNFLKGGLNIQLDGGLVKSIKEVFGGLTDTLGAMQAQIQSKTLMQIAIAVAILTASIIALSLIDSAKLQKAMVGIAAAFGILLGAMATMVQIQTIAGAAKITVLATGMIIMAAAMLILAGAVAILSGFSWQELAKGLGAVAVMLAMVVGVSKTIGDGKGMMAAGLAMIPLAIGLKILATVVGDLAEMSWEELGKGMGALAVGLGIIVGALALMNPKDIMGKAAAMVLIGVALKIMSSALGDMGDMGWIEIAKSMVVLTGALALLAGGLYLMTAALPGAAALIVAAVALRILAPALQMFGDMGWEDIGKAMTVLAGTLIILAVGLTAMILALPGAAALVVAAAALAVMTPVLMALGAMSWEAILKGLTALAGVFAVLGLSALILLPVVPIIVILAGALLVLGASIALIGGGLLMIATSFTIFAAAGTAGLAVLGAMIGLIPLLATNLALGIGAFVTALAGQATVITAALVLLIATALDGLATLIPKAAAVFGALIDAGINIIVGKGGQIVAAGGQLISLMLAYMLGRASLFGAVGAQIIANFINGVASRIGNVVNAAVNLITRFMDAIGQAAPRLTKSGVDMILALVNGIANGIRSRQGEMRSAGSNIGSAIVSGLTAGISGAAGGAIRAAINVAKGALSAAKNALGIHSPSREFYAVGNFSILGMKNAFENGAGTVARAAGNTATSALAAVSKRMDAMSSLVPSVDAHPTIRPVLDLTDISRKAAKIGAMLDPGTVTPTVSYNQAAGISNAQRDLVEQLLAAPPAQPEGIKIEAPLTIHAPAQLDAIDIYRANQSQLAMVASAVQEVTNR